MRNLDDKDEAIGDSATRGRLRRIAGKIHLKALLLALGLSALVLWI